MTPWQWRTDKTPCNGGSILARYFCRYGTFRDDVRTVDMLHVVARLMSEAGFFTGTHSFLHCVMLDCTIEDRL